MITKEYLEAIKYHELQAKLKELGIADVWSTKIKKAEVIQNALKRLAQLKELAESGKNLTDEEIQAKIDLKVAQEEEAKEKELVKAKKQELAQEKSLIKEVKHVAKKMDKEAIEKNIAIIDKNLENNIPGQRDVLLLKRAALEKNVGINI